MSLHIVLVEPEIPQNTGNIARTCAALGATLHLVEPLGFSIDQKSVRRAGLDYWDKLSIHTYPSLDEFLRVHKDGFGQRALEDTTSQGTPTKASKELFFLTTKGKQRYSDVAYPKHTDIFLLFGKESAGLPEDLLAVNKERALRVPMKAENRSLNLANTVAIVAYEVFRQWDFEGLESTGDLHRLDYV